MPYRPSFEVLKTAIRCVHRHTCTVIVSLVLTHKTSVEDRVHLILFLYKVLKEVTQNGYKKELRYSNML